MPEDFLMAHNIYRCMHGVPAVTWSIPVAESAQDWASRLSSMSHSHSYSIKPPAGPAGENLAIGHVSYAAAVQAWYEEVDCCNWPGCQTGSCKVGHFTAMIWEGVTEIGCGHNQLSNIHVCRYRSGDTLTGDTPNMEGHYEEQVHQALRSFDECRAEYLGNPAPVPQIPGETCVSPGSLDRCEKCLFDNQCADGRFCCPYMKKCVAHSNDPCSLPVAQCNSPCSQQLMDMDACSCGNDLFPHFWQLPTCNAAPPLAPATPAPAPTLAPATLAPAPTPAPATAAPGPTPNSECNSFRVPPGFGRISGPWSGDCRGTNYPDKCYFTFIAKDVDDKYIAGLQDGGHFKMVKFDAQGNSLGGKYYRGQPPDDAGAMVTKFDGAKGVGSKYVFNKGDGFCVPSAAPAPAPAPGPTPNSECNNFRVPPGFGRLSGPWSGDCRRTNYPDKCYFTFIAKDVDGKYIAGVQDGRHFKMVKFDAAGDNQAGTGKYCRGCTPEDAAAMVAAYGSANAGPGSRYIFIKGDGFCVPSALGLL